MFIFQNVSSFFFYYTKKWTNLLLYKELARFSIFPIMLLNNDYSLIVVYFIFKFNFILRGDLWIEH